VVKGVGRVYGDFLITLAILRKYPKISTALIRDFSLDEIFGKNGHFHGKLASKK